ncbi:hypothetical protein [Mobiluncus mulieris]|nr:hypothetical protein [Mobiluncus mulieris]NMW75431.1 hypothetical protein [Mobiluncus mulieris]NMX01558.1 hypothetical protein [Mobiluncus mulieris]NMX20195.1 hypothetical protein [Mobiluncus mulieris]
MKIEVDTSTFVGVAKHFGCVSLRMAAKSLPLAPTGVKGIQPEGWNEQKD